MAGYSTSDFLLVWDNFCSLRGTPKWVYSDQGSQLVSAKEMIEASHRTPEQKLEVDMDLVEQETAKHSITWKLAPVESQWRDGRSEAAVKAVKRTLKHMNYQKDLAFHELQSLLYRVMDVINNRPLGVLPSHGAEPGYSPITPNTLLKASRTDFKELTMDRYAPDNHNHAQRQRHMDFVFAEWWQLWMKDVLTGLFPYKKWKAEQYNLREGDICYLMFDSKLGAPTYRLCKVTQVFPDSQNLVRTVEVALRPRDSREKSLPYVHKDLWHTKVSQG